MQLNEVDFNQSLTLTLTGQSVQLSLSVLFSTPTHSSLVMFSFIFMGSVLPIVRHGLYVKWTPVGAGTFLINSLASVDEGLLLASRHKAKTIYVEVL